MTLFKTPFTVALLAQFQTATALRNHSEEALAAAQLEAQWLDDGIEYIYAESEAMDYMGSNEEPESDSVQFSNADSESYNLDPGHYFDLNTVEAYMNTLTQITAEACENRDKSKCPQWGPGDRSSPSSDSDKPSP